MPLDIQNETYFEVYEENSKSFYLSEINSNSPFIR